MIRRLLTVAGIFGFLSFPIITVDATAQAEIKTVKPIKSKLYKQQSANKFPDLTVEKISLDRNRNIIIRIRNSGAGPIQKNQLKDCVVRVGFDRNQEDFYLGASSKQGKPPVDPAGKLLRPGGSVSYNTGIMVHRTLQVDVFVDYRNTIVETDDTNNKSDRITLNP